MGAGLLMETGSCLCGQLHYRFERSQVLSAHHCHCRDCQKVTGSGKATIVMVPTPALHYEGEMHSYTVVGTDGSHVCRGFCPRCGSQILSFVEEMPDIRFVKAGSLDDSSWVTIGSSFWSESAQPWSPVDTSVSTFERNPSF